MKTASFRRRTGARRRPPGVLQPTLRRWPAPERSRPRIRLVTLAALLAATACPGRTPGPATPLRSSIDRGLACVARLYDGDSFRDRYLTYEYPGEALESPVPGERLTYRILDAYFIVLMIRQAGVGPGEAGVLFERAEAATASLVPLWRGKGIYNLRRNPVRGGIALDTYAILAVLRHDAPMGRVVEAGRDGSGWLPDDLYAGDEAFRRLADESWAVRAVLVADPSSGREALRSSCLQTSDALRTETGAIARANLVIHALEALADLAPAAGAGGRGPDPEVDAETRAFGDEAVRLLGSAEIRRDTLTFGNLVGALARIRAGSDATLAPAVTELLRRQDDAGCWNVTTTPGDTAGRVFATLRSVLTLGRYEALLARGR